MWYWPIHPALRVNECLCVEWCVWCDERGGGERRGGVFGIGLKRAAHSGAGSKGAAHAHDTLSCIQQRIRLPGHCIRSHAGALGVVIIFIYLLFLLLINIYRPDSGRSCTHNCNFFYTVPILLWFCGMNEYEYRPKPRT